MQKAIKHSKKVLVAIIGGIVLISGIIMIPYPGPGWLVVFMGLGILATEFTWAENILHRLRQKYEAWQAWVEKQNRCFKILLFIATSIIVIVTIWLFNGYGLLNDWLHLHQDWLTSPFVK